MEDGGRETGGLPLVVRCFGLNLAAAVFATIWTVASVGVTGSPSSIGSDRVWGAVFAVAGAWVLVILLRMEVQLSDNGVTLRRVRTRSVPWQDLGGAQCVRGMWFDAVRIHIENRRLAFWMPVGGLTFSGWSLYWGRNVDDSRSLRLVQALDHYRQIKRQSTP